MSSIRIAHDLGVPVSVRLEPWEEDYTLLPGENYRFTAIGAGPGDEVVYSPRPAPWVTPRAKPNEGAGASMVEDIAK